MLNNAHKLLDKLPQRNSQVTHNTSKQSSLFLVSYPVMTIFLILLCYLLTTPVYSQLDQFTYAGFHDPNNNNLSLSNDARLLNRNGIVQLTSFNTRLTGHVFHSTPFRFKNSTNGTVFSFSTCFALCIVPNQASQGSGDGLTFAIAPTLDFNSSTWGGHLGLLNRTNNGNLSNHVFAVEFDTYQNNEFNDMDANHVGIDINSLISNRSIPASYVGSDSRSNDLNLLSGQPVLAWIDYDSVTRFLNVTLSPLSTRPSVPLLSVELDLSAILFESMYVGFTASTGLLASSHYLLGWSFSMNGAATSLDLNSLPSLPRVTRRNYTPIIVSISVVSFFVIMALTALAVYLVWRIKNTETIEDWEHDIGSHRFKYKELKKATKNFKESELLGAGGFGQVFRGVLPKTDTLVAVKRISHQSNQGLREFISEISSIGRFRHRNLVQLVGWCRRGGELLLVYDYMPNGSLDRFLFDEPLQVLSWATRFKIIKGVASALFYLHEGYEQVVIHRDVKASNVLLDSEMNGRLGDFGLAKLCDHGSNPGTTRVVGTIGYLAPELSRTGRATTGSDVFAFGSLLLEVACGRRPIEAKSGPDDLHVVDYVWNKWKEGAVLDVVDSKLNGVYDENEILIVLKLGLMCGSNEQTARPSMRQVLSYLEGEMEIPDVMRTPGTYVGEGGFEDFLHSYGSSAYQFSNSYTSPR